MSDFLAISTKYYEAGLSVVALNANKTPLGQWKERQNELLPPTPVEKYKTCYGIGIICGPVSGGIEVVDVDSKYDITGTLMERFTAAVNSNCDIMGRVVIETTQNKGYHIIYRCSEIQGNQKLANRYCTEDELKQEPNEKVKCLLETRGMGGFFMCAPSPGYEVTQGDLLNIPIISPEDRKILLETAKAFNEVYQPEHRKDIKYGEDNPFSQYDDTSDTVALLQEYGWEVKGQCDGNIMLKRPGTTDSKWSGGFHPDKKLFHTFSTSTVFSTDKAYSPSGVLCMLKFNGDWRECAKWLHDRNYGKQVKKVTENKPVTELFTTIKAEKTYLQQVREGTLQMGLGTGLSGLDEYWRLKSSYLVVINGVDNVGKSQVMWYLYILAACTHGWNFLIYAGENPNAGTVFRKLMEFYMGKPLNKMSTEEYKKAEEFIEAHFTIIKNTGVFTHRDMLDIGDKAMSQKKYNVFMIDPYNSLYRDKKKGMNPHDYDYEALGEIRQWISDSTCSVHIICHSATEALRKYYPRDHDRYPNLVMPPNKADTEGGGKFANRADDFLTIHRHTQSADQWMWTEIYNRKNRDNDTGGRQTPYDRPFRMKMVNGVQFVDENGYNPVTKKNFANEVSNFIEPRNESEEAPF